MNIMYLFITWASLFDIDIMSFDQVQGYIIVAVSAGHQQWRSAICCGFQQFGIFHCRFAFQQQLKTNILRSFIEQMNNITWVQLKVTQEIFSNPQFSKHSSPPGSWSVTFLGSLRVLCLIRKGQGNELPATRHHQ